ncbi:metallophosphoesterase family protein [Thioflexithrix psekupsensis]|uniref:DNA repair exonuclease n=1 Tax=Thioflexithrix psekupsensis TaxID=1570016 RepID=A0A251X8N9_9GAMM|nr:DNA repair exonuclease [Thioflexithrix psekupsensis]OUD14144.1 DNA repair exonuclease [Thioflexithrix psekupsensis]
MKFIHAADIHLDSPLCGLARYEGAPLEQMQTATRRAFLNLIDLACQEAVDFVLLAGDLYDGDWKDYNTGLFFHQQMTRLRAAHIPVFIVYGNHDAGNVMTRQLQLPDNVREFSQQHPETFRLDNLKVALHGQSFPTRAVSEDLSANYPKPITGYYNIGLLHTSLEGREGHASYAPCSVKGLLSHGYDYWALGHVHHREIVHQSPYIVFPGNVQGRHVREAGAKGCTLVTVRDHVTELKHCPLDVLRWDVCELDITPFSQAEDLIQDTRDRMAQLLQQAHDRPLAVRLILTGSSDVHTQLHRQPERWLNELRAAATDGGLGHLWIEKILLQSTPPTPLEDFNSGPLGELMSTLRRLPVDQNELDLLRAELKPLKQALPVELRSDSIDPDNPETIRHLLGGVEEFLMARLLAQST